MSKALTRKPCGQDSRCSVFSYSLCPEAGRLGSVPQFYLENPLVVMKHLIVDKGLTAVTLSKVLNLESGW